MNTLIQDLRYAIRQLRNAPGFALAAVVTLALGIGATIAVYTLVDGILLRPLPYVDPARLLVLDSKESSLTYADLLQIDERSQGRLTSAAVLAGWSARLEADGIRVPVFIVETTANLPSVLGVEPVLGRGFRPDENEPGKNNVMLLSDRVWHSAFAADQHVIGKIVSVSGGAQYTVIGVMPASFAIPMDADDEVWTPRSIAPAAKLRMGNQDDAMDVNLGFIRPSAGITAALAGQLVSQIQRRIVSEQSNIDLPKDLTSMDYLASLNRPARMPLLLLLGVGASFWLLASLNVVSLLIARATGREREFAVRSALGASRARLLRQSIAESLLLNSMASVLGLMLATAAIKLLWHAITRHLPLSDRIHIQSHVVIALVALTALTGVLVGILPAIRASGKNVQAGLRGGAAPLATVQQQRLRFSLTAGQLMITMVLLAGAGLFLRTVTALRGVPLGFSEQNVLTGGIMQPAGVRSISVKGDAGIVERRYLPLLDRLRHMPGVQSATLSSVMPMRSDFEITLIGKLDGKEGVAGKPFQAAGRAASPGLPETFGIPMLRGRFFMDADTPSSPAVVVVNQAFVDKYLVGLNPIGHTFGLSKGRMEAMPIVGVIGDVKQGTVTHNTVPEVYLCLAQVTPGTAFYQPVTAFMQVGIRARIPAQSLRRQFEAAVDQVDPDAQTIDVKTIHEAVEDSFGSQTLMAHLLEGFSAMALFIAMVGLYGTVAFSVAQRTREFGVRLALGAPQQSIQRLVVQKAMWPVFAGLAAGDIVLWFATRLVRSYLFGVAPHDAGTLVMASLILVATGILSAFIPARRAAAVDPMQALRTE